MVMAEGLRQLRGELRELARQLVANAIQFTRFSLSTSSGEGDQVAGHKTEGAGEEEYDYEVRRLQHFGFRSRPPKDVWALRVAASGGATNGATVAEESTRYGPSDLEDGEVALYNKVDGLEIRFDKDGNIRITCAQGKKVLINRGGRGIARVDDTVKVTIPAGTFLVSAQNGQSNQAAVEVSGKITSASDTAESG
jgi:phage gp45-like